MTDYPNKDMPLWKKLIDTNDALSPSEKEELKKLQTPLRRAEESGKLSSTKLNPDLVKDGTGRNKEQLTPRDFAVFRHVWQLTSTERALLDRCFLLRTTAATLISAVDAYYKAYLPAYRDTIQYENCHIELEYLHTSLIKLEDAEDQSMKLLLSVRINYNSAMAIALVKEVDMRRYDEEQYMGIPELPVMPS